MPGSRPSRVAIGLVGVEHAAALVGDQRALRQIVDEGLGDVVAAVALAEMEDADGAGEQAEHADHGKTAENGKDEGLGHLARDHGKGDGGNGKPEREQHHETDIAVAFGLIGGRLGVTHWSVDIRHAAKISDSISLLDRTLSLRRFRLMLRERAGYKSCNTDCLGKRSMPDAQPPDLIRCGAPCSRCGDRAARLGLQDVFWTPQRFEFHRARDKRLGVVETAAMEGHRKLVLMSRDKVEHSS